MNLSKLYKQLSIFTFSLFCFSTNLLAQDSMPDFARSMGKMYVVVAVIITIFIGLVAFLIYMERRVAKLEKQLDIEE